MGMRPPSPPNKGGHTLKDEKSELEKYVEEACAARKLYDFDLEGFTSLGGRPVPKYKCRVVTKSESNRAIVGATTYVEECTRGTSLAKDDPDLLTDAKACFVLWESARQFSNPLLPAFPSPRWMMDNMNAEQIGILFNNYALCVAKEGTMVSYITDEVVDNLSEACVMASNTELPGRVLSSLTREALVEFAIRQAIKISELKVELFDADQGGHLGTEEEGLGGEAGAGETSGGDGPGDEGGGDGNQAGQDVPEPNL